jgi:hypothetical protein
MNLPEFSANATQAAARLAEIAKDHPDWEAVKSSDGFFYLFDGRNRNVGFVAFASGKITLHVKQPSQVRINER